MSNEWLRTALCRAAGCLDPAYQERGLHAANCLQDEVNLVLGELEAEVERLRGWKEIAEAERDEMITEGERVTHERDRYREALERYGRCRSDCELVRALHRGENPTVCSCGYQAALDGGDVDLNNPGPRGHEKMRKPQ